MAKVAAMLLGSKSMPVFRVNGCGFGGELLGICPAQLEIQPHPAAEPPFAPAHGSNTEMEEAQVKRHVFRKAVSLVSAAALAVGMFAGVVNKPASAAGAVLGYWPEPLEIPNEYYYENETLQPYGSCFQIDELKNWSPDNDPDARYNRGAIELRERWMGPNVNPLASRDAKVMPLAMANARASQAPSQGTDEDFVYAFNNFQYVDIFNFWGGSSAEGPIAIPSPEVIDAAHRNGVPATGTIFLPWGDGAYGNRFVQEMVEQDENGNFIAADKLIEIAQYYGFDGYIFNAESGTGVSGFREFLIYLQEHKPDNFTITWYNGSGNVSTGSITSWMQDGDTRITDHWWLDMSGGWSGPSSSIAAAEATGVDPWNIHSTWEYWPMASGSKGGDYVTRLEGQDRANGKLISSLGILAPTSSMSASSSSADFINVQDQKLWVGPTFDPSSTYRPANEFCGFASLVADRTPVIGTDFVTNFTTGNGYRFYEDGVVIGKEDGWSNRSLTDVLPTWRWIIESDGQKLDAIIDFEDAWYGGTSMKFSGSMDAGLANHIKLYSAQLAITQDSKFTFIYKTPVNGVNVELGLCFGDTYDAENFKFYPVETTADGQWNTATVDLSEDAGKTAIAISLRFTAPEGVTDYTINVGQMGFTTHDTAPAATEKVTLDEVIYPTDKTMEARVYWEAAEDAFMYRIYRVHTDGTREFVGATPSDAFYLGSFEKEEGETACNFEIVSYSENCVKGGVTRFSIAWPEEVPDGFVPVFEEGPNLALNAPAVSSVACTNDGAVRMINDGVIANSKWCSTSSRGYAVIDLGENKEISRWVVYHANCPGAGEGVDMNTVAFDLSYAPDDGQPLLTGDDAESRQRVATMSFTAADAVTGNKQDITDRNLDAPITARYVKLNVTDSDNSAWSAIRIYEFELYENAAISNTASPYARNITVKNNAGATDTVVVDNVKMLYSSGTYADGNGVFHEDTGKVRLFTDLTSEEPFAVVNATQPDESYKQRGVGIAKFSGLELNPEGGRLYYDVLDGSGAEVTNSRRASVYYAPESGDPIGEPESVTLTRTTYGVQLRQQYATLTATGLEDGVTMRIFTSADAETAILHTLPAENGVITQSRVPLDSNGGTVYYELYKEGKPDSPRYALPYGDPMELGADLSGLLELIAKCDKIAQADCTSATWPAFAEKLAAAKTVAAGTPTAAQAETARAELNEAYANLRFKASTQRLAELCAEFAAAYPEANYTASTYAVFAAALKAAEDAIAADDSSAYEVEQLRIALEEAVRGLVEVDAISGVTIDPETATVAQGGTQRFTATVTGTGTVDQSVTWSLSGNADDGTTLVNGLLTVASGETATTLTVTATSVADSTKSASATVTVTETTDPTDPPEPTTPGGEVDEDTNVALNATVVAYNGPESGNGALGSSNGPEKLFDGLYANADTDKWCVDGKDMWVAFDIGQNLNVAKAIIRHAGAANESPAGKINTSDFQLYTLDTSKISVEDLLAMSYEERCTLLADNAYWTEIVNVTGNTSDITTHEFDAQDARIFKLNVSKTDTTGWADCVRIYELELYAQGQTTQEVTVTVEPKTMTVDANPGQKGQFTAVVTGTDNTDVTWSISGNTSSGTRIDNGQLFLGQGETGTTLIVTATSVADPTKSDTATVTVNPVTYQIIIADTVVNGIIIPSKTEAQEGETITLTITPNQGYVLVDGSLKANGMPVENNQFVMPGEDVYITAEFSSEADLLLNAAKEAQAAAEAARKAAEEAKAAAEAAQAAAEEAAESAAADKDAAEQAAEEAAAAQAEAEAAQKAAEAAQKAAEDAAAAAEASNLAAAEEAAKAAAEAAAAAESAADAAKYAEEAATAMRAAQAAQEAAEAAQAKAEAAQAAAEEAQKAAEEAAASTAEDKEAAEKAKAEAEAAQKAAEDAQAAAENAAAAAEESRKAAEAHDAAAAQAAADAAKYAQEVAEKYEEICAMKAEMAQYLLDAQQAAQAAEESAKAAAEAELAAAKYYALFTLATYADKNDYAEAQQVELAAAIEAGNQAINAATSVEGVEAALAAAKETIDGIKTLADLEAEKPPFTDVAEGAWYYDAVKYVYHNGLFQGVSETIFRPESPMNRAMVVTVLHRLAGSPAAEGEIAFTDVPADQYYEEALIWAVDNGLAEGVSETAFAPTSPVTREQLVTFLYRYAEFAGMDVSGKADLTVFADSDKVSSYAEEAMAWAVDAGIIDGVGNNTLAPRNNATRAQVAAMLMRFDQLG